MVLRRVREWFRRRLRREPLRREEVREKLKNRVMEELRGSLTADEEKIVAQWLEDNPELDRATNSILNTLEAHRQGRTIFGVTTLGLGGAALAAALTGGAALPFLAGFLAAGAATGALHAGRPRHEELIDRHARRIAEQVRWALRHTKKREVPATTGAEEKIAKILPRDKLPPREEEILKGLSAFLDTVRRADERHLRRLTNKIDDERLAGIARLFAQAEEERAQQDLRYAAEEARRILESAKDASEAVERLLELHTKLVREDRHEIARELIQSMLKTQTYMLAAYRHEGEKAAKVLRIIQKLREEMQKRGGQ